MVLSNFENYKLLQNRKFYILFFIPPTFNASCQQNQLVTGDQALLPTMIMSSRNTPLYFQDSVSTIEILCKMLRVVITNRMNRKYLTE